VVQVSRDIRTAFHPFFDPAPARFLAIEPVFWLVLFGISVGVTIQAVIVGGMIATLLTAAVPHHAKHYHHKLRHHAAVWFGGRDHGAHVHPAMG
jgi:hypothetical protein